MYVPTCDQEVNAKKSHHKLAQEVLKARISIAV